MVGYSEIRGPSESLRYVPLGNMTLRGTLFGYSFLSFADGAEEDPASLGGVYPLVCRFKYTETVAVYPTFIENVEADPTPSHLKVVLYYRKDTGLLATN